MNQHDLATACLDATLSNLSHDIQVVVLDNGSDKPFEYSNSDVKVIRYDKSIGVYPTFWEGLKHTTGDVIAFFHSDFFVSEKDWDIKVLNAFRDMKIGLAGFIGSDEIDANGGRGYGTMSNFQGLALKYLDKEWKGSPATAHGKRITGVVNSAVIDGCSMIFRRSVLEQIKQRENFPPHHFYDRLLCCETLEKGFKVVTIGVACDHISGQTVSNEQKYTDMANEWGLKHGVMLDDKNNWDSVIYLEAERQWLKEYRDEKHFIPIQV